MSQILQKAEKAVSSHEPGHKPHGPKEGDKLNRDHGKFKFVGQPMNSSDDFAARLPYLQASRNCAE